MPRFDREEEERMMSFGPYESNQKNLEKRFTRGVSPGERVRGNEEVSYIDMNAHRGSALPREPGVAYPDRRFAQGSTTLLPVGGQRNNF